MGSYKPGMEPKPGIEPKPGMEPIRAHANFKINIFIYSSIKFLSLWLFYCFISCFTVDNVTVQYS